jgi:hypothetical protein
MIALTTATPKPIREAEAYPVREQRSGLTRLKARRPNVGISSPPATALVHHWSGWYAAYIVAARRFSSSFPARIVAAMSFDSSR